MKRATPFEVAIWLLGLYVAAVAAFGQECNCPKRVPHDLRVVDPATGLPQPVGAEPLTFGPGDTIEIAVVARTFNDGNYPGYPPDDVRFYYSKTFLVTGFYQPFPGQDLWWPSFDQWIAHVDFQQSGPGPDAPDIAVWEYNDTYAPYLNPLFGWTGFKAWWAANEIQYEPAGDERWLLRPEDCELGVLADGEAWVFTWVMHPTDIGWYGRVKCYVSFTMTNNQTLGGAPPGWCSVWACWSAGSSTQFIVEPEQIGDLDGDGCVGLTDLETLLDHYGDEACHDIQGPSYHDCLPYSYSFGDICQWPAVSDGWVDMHDLLKLLAHYGEGCP